MGARMEILTNFVIRLGLVNPSEPTCRVFAALLLLSSRKDPMQLTSAEKYEFYTLQKNSLPSP